MNRRDIIRKLRKLDKGHAGYITLLATELAELDRKGIRKQERRRALQEVVGFAHKETDPERQVDQIGRELFSLGVREGVFGYVLSVGVCERIAEHIAKGNVPGIPWDSLGIYPAMREKIKALERQVKESRKWVAIAKVTHNATVNEIVNGEGK